MDETAAKSNAESGALLLKRTLSDDEYESISIAVRNKIEVSLGEHIEDYVTAKALFESTQAANDTKISELKESLEKAVQERDGLKTQVDGLLSQCEDLTSQLTSSQAELNRLRQTVTRYEKEVEVVRKERNEAVDERQIATNLVERKSCEVERLQSDLGVVTEQLRQAVAAKCEALAATDDLASKHLELELKEKRLDTERTLLTQQNVDLRADLAKLAEELTQQRRESSAEIQSLTTKLSLRDDELTHANDAKTVLTKTNEELTTRIDNLTESLKKQMDAETDMIEKNQKEIKSYEKLIDLHKNMMSVYEGKISELSTAVRELQRLLTEATSQHGEMETRLAQQEEDHKTELAHKDKALEALRLELQAANQLLSQIKQESTEEAISRLSPLAASTGRLLRSGLTLTQLYAQYASVSEELIQEKQEKAKLTEYVNRILKEIEERAPVLKKQREDYDYAMQTVEGLSVKVDELEKEQATLRKQARDSECSMQFLARENKRFKTMVSDLSRQVCVLLKELEGARGNFIPVHDSPKAKADIKTTSDLIERHLVTFKDIEELQINNQKLIASLRELSEEKDAEEVKRESKELTELKNELRLLKSKIIDLEGREENLLKQIDIVKGQRDLYERLLKQHAKPGALSLASDEPTHEDGSPSSQATPAATPPARQPPQEPDNGSKKALEEVKSTFDAYRQEKATNEKMLTDTIRGLQDGNSKLRADMARLLATSDYNLEKSKTLAATNKSLRAQNQGLEQKCTTYLDTTTRLQEANKQLRQDAMNAMTKLSVLEVTSANLKQENALLRDSEKRLISERNTERKMRVGQEMLMANLEALKAKVECSDAEGRLRLEARLDEAHAECSALRRRLQEEQDRLGKKVELGEEQLKTLKVRLEEEAGTRERLQSELEEARQATKRAEESTQRTSSRLGSAITSSQPVIQRDNQIKDLEIKIQELETNIKMLEEKLAHAKKVNEDLKELGEVTDQQLKHFTGLYESLKKESDEAIGELRKTEGELRSQISQLEVRASTWRAAEAEVAAQREGELASLRTKVESLGDQLRAERERTEKLQSEVKEASVQLTQVTDKYTEEMQAKAVLQQECEKLKTEVSGLEGRLEEAEREVSRAQEALRVEREAATARDAQAAARLTDTEAKLAELSSNSDILQQQIGVLTERLATPMPSSPDTPQDSNLPEESKTFVTVLQCVRKEKMAALRMAESLKSEKLHLEAEVQVLRIQLEESKKALDEAREKTETPSIAAAKHAEMLQNAEAVGQLSETNKCLSDEVSRLRGRLAEVEAQALRMDEEVVSPAKMKASELTTRIDDLQIENQCLKQETTRWQARTEELIEKVHKTNPEDLKKLTLEKENLTKQLTTEKEQAKASLARMKLQIESLEKEKVTLKSETAALEARLGETRTELEAQKGKVSQTSELLQQMETNTSQLASQVEENKAKEMQLRQIAKKYKTQFMELSKTLEEEKRAKLDVATSPPPPSTSAPQTQDPDQVKLLNQQVVSLSGELENVKKENESLQSNSMEKEERAKSLLKNARNRVVQLTEEKNMLLKELSDFRTKPKGDAESRITVLESRITRLEKEKSEEQTEKERLGSEVELLTQKLSILQRQIDKHQGSKPSTSCAEKGTNEPPTANIKPMDGTSRSTSKQHQGQHSATVTPWRETTPFASIRPMSQPTRTTVVVLPTSQTTSTSNQPVMVAPQQSVHTSSSIEAAAPSSSHMDYMPVTSSHAAGPALTRPVMPEDEAPAQPQQQNVALVMPQPQRSSAPTPGPAQPQPMEQHQVEEGGGPAVASSQEGSSGTTPPTGPASCSSSVTTSQSGKRPPSTGPDTESKAKRSRQGDDDHSDTLDVEYQVPTSSQRDQDDPLVISDDDDIPDQGAIEDGGDFEEEAEEEARYGIETYSHNGQELTSFDDAEGPDIDEESNTDQDNNEVEIIDEGNEVPNQCESSGGGSVGGVGAGSEATSSGALLSQQPYQARRAAPTPASLPLLSRHHMMLSYEESGDDSIVPSTPTLYVPRRTDGFGEAVSSPHVPSPRFTFHAESQPQTSPSQQASQSIGGGVAQVASEGMDDTRMDLSQLDEGRRVPTAPTHVSPQDGGSSSGSTSSSSGSAEIGQSMGAGEADEVGAGGSTSELAAAQTKPDDTSTSSTDGVTSEGEKRGEGPSVGGEEEGREAEASRRGRARRSVRVTARRAPQPIVWSDQPNSTSAPTPTTQTVTMLPLRDNLRGVTRSRGAMVRGGEPQPGPSHRPPFPRGNRARRSSRMPFHFAPGRF